MGGRISIRETGDQSNETMQSSNPSNRNTKQDQNMINASFNANLICEMARGLYYTRSDMIWYYMFRHVPVFETMLLLIFIIIFEIFEGNSIYNIKNMLHWLYPVRQ